MNYQQILRAIKKLMFHCSTIDSCPIVKIQCSIMLQAQPLIINNKKRTIDEMMRGSSGESSSSIDDPKSSIMQLHLSYFLARESKQVLGEALDEIIVRHYESLLNVLSIVSLNKERSCIVFHQLEDCFHDVNQLLDPIKEYLEIYQLLNHHSDDDTVIHRELYCDGTMVPLLHLKDRRLSYSRGVMTIQDVHESVLSTHVLINRLEEEEDIDFDSGDDMKGCVKVKVTCVVNSSILKDKEQLKQFANQCFSACKTEKSKHSSQTGRHRNAEAVFHLMLGEQEKTVEKLSLSRSGEWVNLEEDRNCIGNLFVSCWTDNLLENVGLSFVTASGKLFWFIDDNGLFCSLVYPLKSVNYPTLKSIDIVMDYRQSNSSETHSNLLPDALSKSLGRLFQNMKENPTCSNLFLSVKQFKNVGLLSSYIPTIGDSIQEICQLSSNQEFLSQCFRLLNIDSVSGVSEAIQAKLRLKVIQ